MIFLVPLALAAPTQTVTVLLQGAQGHASYQAFHGDGESVTLFDPGLGMVMGEWTQEPRRELQLRLVTRDGGGARTIYDGLVVLPDAEQNVVAFAFDPSRDRGARRVPATPSARAELKLDQRATWWVGFGWGALASVWGVGMGITWALRRR